VVSGAEDSKGEEAGPEAKDHHEEEEEEEDETAVLCLNLMVLESCLGAASPDTLAIDTPRLANVLAILVKG
jgi:hypothetical protein